MIEDTLADRPRAPAPTQLSPSSPSGAAVVPLGALATTSLLSACGGGGNVEASAASSNQAPLSVASHSGYTYLVPSTDQEAARFLLQTQFSASDAQIAAVRSSGYLPWLAAQFSAPKGGTGWDWLNSKGYGDVLNPANYFDSSSPGDYMVWNQLITGPDPVRKRAALALSEFFVVSLSGLSFSWRSHAAAHYWDTLCAHALGNFRDLLEAITLNTAMGYYLNTKGNKGENSAGRQPDENYAREVMQLFTIGLHMLNPDGTVQLDGAGKPIDSYTATDVSNLARVFTGYDLDQSQNVPTVIPQTGGGTRTVSNTAFARLPMAFTQNNHSTRNVDFLGVSIAGSANASVALKTALDTLFNHPNAAPFFCKQMVQRLVTSNPSPAYVARVAAVFANNGLGVRGALADVFAAILLDDEARGPAGLGEPEFGKLREPMVRFVQWARSFGVTSATGAWKIGDLSSPASALGQSPLRSPSVFNFFRPGYVPPSSALTAGRVAPEFQLVTESSVGGYLNYMQNVINTGINSSDIKASYTAELALVTDAAALVRRLNTVLCAGQLSSATQTLITNALNTTTVISTSSDTAKRNRVCAAVLLVMASVEYLIQK